MDVKQWETKKMIREEIKLSVIVPVCNVEQYVEQCIQSIMGQTMRDLEIIVIDDGSTDSSGKLVDVLAAKDPRIQVIHKENRGYGHTVNMGIRLAKGKYVGIVESDDYIREDMYEKLLGLALNIDADVVKGDFYRVINNVFLCDHIYKGLITGQCTTIEENKLLFSGRSNIWCAVYKRSYLLENDIWCLETPGASYQDISFSFKAWCMASKIALVDEPLLFYRMDNPSSSVHSQKKIFCVCDEIREIERYLNERDLKGSWQENMKDVDMVRLYHWNYYRLHPGIRYAFYRVMAKEICQINLKKVNPADWSEELLNVLVEIQKDEDAYFWRTSYQLWEHELDNETMIGALTLEAVRNEILHEDKIVIYGAGIYGSRMLLYVKDLTNEDRVYGFAVTGEPEMTVYEGKPVRNIDMYDRDCLVIVAVKNAVLQKEILGNLKALGFDKLLRMDETWRTHLLNREDG